MKKAWLHNQALQSHDNIKIIHELQLIEAFLKELAAKKGTGFYTLRRTSTFWLLLVSLPAI
jgi:hypothetical protein